MKRLVNPDTGGTKDYHLREDWGARAATRTVEWQPDVSRETLVLHHSAGPLADGFLDSASLLRAYQHQHIAVNGWSDIAYNFAVNAAGDLFELRGFFVRNGANTPANSKTYSIVYLGNTDLHPFTHAAAATIEWMLDYLNAGVSACPGQCALGAHNDYSATSCPGDNGELWLANRGLAPVEPPCPTCGCKCGTFQHLTS